MKTTIIIPTLNESKILANTLEKVKKLQPHEIIIGDGGSQDETLEIAKTYPTKIVLSPPGRSLQMNAAAGEASGDILLFHHADSFITKKGFEKMNAVIAKGKYFGGAFSLQIDSDQPRLKRISRWATLRSRFLNLTYGDQAIFVRRDIFEELNGYMPIPICEDLDFSLRLKKRGPMIILKDKSYTSPRRWLKEGIGFTTARNLLISSLFLLGVSPNRLCRWYPPKR